MAAGAGWGAEEDLGITAPWEHEGSWDLLQSSLDCLEEVESSRQGRHLHNRKLVSLLCTVMRGCSGGH